MIIQSIKKVPGANILEKNRNRRLIIQFDAKYNLKSKEIDQLFLTKNKKQYKNILSNILYQEISELFVNLTFNKINKNDFLSWYRIRGREGCFDLIKYFKLY